MNPKTKNQIKFVLKVMIAAVLVFVVFRSGHLKLTELQGLLTPINIAALLGMLGLNLWLLNWRWYFLLKSRGFEITFAKTFSLYLIGVFFNHALPSSVGGDVVKAYYIANDHSHRRMDAVMSVLIDRALGLYSMLLLSIVSIALDFAFVASHPEVRFMAIGCVALVTAITIMFLIGFSKKTEQYFGILKFLHRHPKLHFIAKILTAFQVYGESPKTILISIVVGAFAQLITVGLFVYVGWALHLPQISLPAYLFCVPIGFVAMALPIAPAGVGVGQVAFLYLFQTYANSGDAGAVAITAFQLALLTWGLVGSVFYVRYKKPDA